MSDELETAAAAGDSEAMVALAARLQARARELEAEAAKWIERAALAGSLAGWHAWARIEVASADYDSAVTSLLRIEKRFPDEPSQWVSVAPDVLGRDLPLDSDGVSELHGVGVFTVITPYGDRALELLRPVARELLRVDELGGIQTEDPPPGEDPLFTPSYVERRSNRLAVQLSFDTDGVMTGPMGRTMVAIIAEALAGARIPAHIAGERADLRPRLTLDQDD